MDIDDLDAICDDGLKAARWLKQLGRIIGVAFVIGFILYLVGP